MSIELLQADLKDIVKSRGLISKYWIVVAQCKNCRLIQYQFFNGVGKNVFVCPCGNREFKEFRYATITIKSYHLEYPRYFRNILNAKVD